MSIPPQAFLLQKIAGNSLNINTMLPPGADAESYEPSMQAQRSLEESGEYAMVKAAAKMGWIDEERIIGEMAVGAYRAGAQIYITYFAEEIAKMMEEGRIG